MFLSAIVGGGPHFERGHDLTGWHFLARLIDVRLLAERRIFIAYREQVGKLTGLGRFIHLFGVALCLSSVNQVGHEVISLVDRGGGRGKRIMGRLYRPG